MKTCKLICSQILAFLCFFTNSTESIPVSPLIVGGVEALKGEFPFMIGIRRRTEGHPLTFSHMCGGVLVSSSWVLTASHCSMGPLSEYLIVAGDHLKEVEEGTEQRRMVLRTVIHPEYNAATNENDIALIKVSKPFKLNQFIQPAVLPPEGFIPEIGSILMAAGWGRLFENGNNSPVLMKVDVPFVNDELCREFYSQSRIKDNMLCAGEEGKDSCKADSGGPILCPLNNGERVVCGTSAFGTGCAQKDKPGVYMELTYYKEWIKSVIN